MRYLGIDYGRVRIGIARSDEEGTMAFPDRVIAVGTEAVAAEEIAKIARDAGAGAVVMGLPLALDGAETEESRRARSFAEMTRIATGLPVYLENEIFTSRMADHAGVAKDKIDAASAAIILQSYLDRKIKDKG